MKKSIEYTTELDDLEIAETIEREDGEILVRPWDPVNEFQRCVCESFVVLRDMVAGELIAMAKRIEALESGDADHSAIEHAAATIRALATGGG